MVDHLFRQESGKMVAVLTRIFGFANIEQAEDIVQDTLLKALEVWKWGKVPDNPQAWLYQSAKNKAIDLIRREKLKFKIEHEFAKQTVFVSNRNKSQSTDAFFFDDFL